MARFTCNFISYVLMRAVDITVVIPSPTVPEAIMRQLEEEKGNETDGTPVDDLDDLKKGGDKLPERASHLKPYKYPVLYLFHGMGNNHATWNSYSRIEMYAEERNIAVVMISADNKSYVNHCSGDRYFDFIDEELPAFIKGMFPISERREDTYLAGLSMGGYGVLIHGLSRPDKYHAVGTFSFATGLDPFQLIGEERKPDDSHIPEALAKRDAEEKKEFPVFYMACGENDPGYMGNKELADLLKRLGAKVTWKMFPGYGHEWRFWDEAVEDFLDFIPRTDEYCKKGKRQV